MEKITVLGCGLMGVKIAGELAYHGHQIKMFDNNLDVLNNVYQKIEEDERQLKKEGRLSHKGFKEHSMCLSQLEESVKDADFIIECVVDDLEVKQDLFKSVFQCCKKTAIVATNSLGLDINDIAEGAAFREVEIKLGKSTSPDVIEKVRTMLEKMGKTLIFRCGDDPLVLTEEQREARKFAGLEQITNSSDLGTHFQESVPAVMHKRNVAPAEDENDSG